MSFDVIQALKTAMSQPAVTEEEADAPQTIDLFPEEQDEFLRALESEAGIQAAITDGSVVADFCLNEEQIAAISEALGIPVSDGDSALDVCMRLSARKMVN